MLRYLLEKEFKQILRNDICAAGYNDCDIPFRYESGCAGREISGGRPRPQPSIGKAGAEGVRFGLLPSCRRVAHLRGGDAER